MHFGNYLKQCREKIGLTQEQLAHNLYAFDIDSFEGVQMTTISKWERAVSQPKLSRQVSILRYFQGETGKPLPCMEGYSAEEAEALICETGMLNLIVGPNNKELVLDFASEIVTAQNLSVVPIRHTDRVQAMLEIAADIRNSANPAITRLDAEKMQQWTLYPGNLFWVCRYKGITTGLLFSLKLKQEVFDQLIGLEKKLEELQEEDFAALDESGSHYLLAFFALNDKTAEMLFIRYYAHLIANQSTIEELGATASREEAKKILRNMNLHFAGYHAEADREVRSFRETLRNALAYENVVKIILSKEACPEE